MAFLVSWTAAMARRWVGEEVVEVELAVWSDDRKPRRSLN